MDLRKALTEMGFEVTKNDEVIDQYICHRVDEIKQEIAALTAEIETLTGPVTARIEAEAYEWAEDHGGFLALPDESGWVDSHDEAKVNEAIATLEQEARRQYGTNY